MRKALRRSLRRSLRPTSEAGLRNLRDFQPKSFVERLKVKYSSLLVLFIELEVVGREGVWTRKRLEDTSFV